MFDFYKRYKERKRKEARIAGYNWAAGALLRGEETPLSIDANIFQNNYTVFDQGVNDACRELIRLGVVENDLFM